MESRETSGMSSGASHQLRVDQLKKIENRPNILLIMTDQQRADTINASGSEFMITPNMDRLAIDGRLYKNGYSPNPICMPARHNMLTGLTARYHGYPDNAWGFGMPDGLPTFPEILSDNGYETRTIGKNHFYPPRRHNGYLNMELMQEVPAFREQDEYLLYLRDNGLGNIQNIHGVRNLLYMVPQQSQIPEEHHGTTWVANRTIDFIESNNGRHPWLLKMGWIAPHPPFDVPKEFADLYKDVKFPEPLVSETQLSPLAEENKLLGDLPSKQYIRRMKELYYGAISHVDHHLGRVLDSLEKTDQLDNTLIIFTSDHGEMLGDYSTYQKWLPYNACSKIPFIIRYPKKIKPGVITEEFADLNDIFPTILEAAGLKYPGKHELPGESLITDDPKKDRNQQYVEYSDGNRRWISLTNHDYKYNYYFGGGREELFDLKNDPGECRNLMEFKLNTRQLQAKDKLRKELIKTEDRWGLIGSIENGDLVVRDKFIPTPYRNKAFPLFPDKLTNANEIQCMNTHMDEVIAVTANEDVVHLQDLDLKVWQLNGNYSDEDIDTLLKKEKDKK
ncbi:MAG: sulfatase-like hydrolase/transferase [Spirochaetaceae bacterium]